jgi:aspartate/tyrosine/aromatic aminotransferase
MAMNRVNHIVGHLEGNAAQNQIDTVDCAFMDDVNAAPADAILGISQAYQADTDARKINVSVGAYRTNEGKPLVLQCVTKAEEIIQKDKSLNKEYLRQRGDPEYTNLARTLLFGKTCKPLVEGRIASCQTLSGTGSLRVGAEFIKRFLPGRTVYHSSPTWGTHKSILSHANVPAKPYRYWDAKGKKLDIKGMLEDISSAPMGSIFLLHAAAHNPTGVDPTHEQWLQIAEACQRNGNICWFDSAYQGFATGDLEKDAFAISHFANSGFPVMASQSFAKNFGLYGERIGTFNVVCARAEKVAPVMSQLDIIIRNLYSNPPKHGAMIVKTVLKDPALTQMWKDELLQMSLRIQAMRKALVGELKKLGTPGDWSHITSQIGMFSFTGLSKPQCENMTKKHHIYMLMNGRVSMAGVTTKNVGYIAAAIDETVRNVN